ncbi:hypothetical protein JHK86_024328 [Glycine max]|nr:hypothetical protein JHK86_024328 [Glycine max]
MEDGDVRHSVLEYILRTDDPLLPSTLIKKTLLLGTLQDHLYPGAGAGEGTFLLSLELEQWRSNIEASLSDLQVRERFAFVDTRREAAVKLELAASEQINNNVVAENRLEAQHQERGAVEFQKVREYDSAELQKLADDSLLNSLEVNEEAPTQSRDADVPFPHVTNNNEE